MQQEDEEDENIGEKAAAATKVKNYVCKYNNDTINKETNEIHDYTGCFEITCTQQYLKPYIFPEGIYTGCLENVCT